MRLPEAPKTIEEKVFYLIFSLAADSSLRVRILIHFFHHCQTDPLAFFQIDEARRQAALWYTRNTIPTYSKVPIAIQALRRTPFGNFVSFPAEMLRTTFNNFAISMKEASSAN